MHHGNRETRLGAHRRDDRRRRAQSRGTADEDIVDLGIVLVPEGDVSSATFRRGEPRARRVSKVCARALDRNLAFCYDAFPILATRAKQLAGSMSGGEQQMLTLARALMTAPRSC